MIGDSDTEQIPLPLPGLSTQPAPSEVPHRHRIHVNRNLRFDLISMVGFDMDYTLAIYRQQAMDRLSIDVTLQKLVELGHPESLLGLKYRTDFPIRGLLIDRKLGNTLKMDRYRYVKKAYHGTRMLSREERQQLYEFRAIKAGSPRYHWVDTLYGLSEVTVYTAAIDHLEQCGHDFDPDALFGDVRRSIDLAHQDGSILDCILADPERYLHRDPNLGATFHRLRSAGKRLFLLTNSRAAYTETLMTWLLEDSLGDYTSWRSFFDIIVTGAQKPRFFTDEDRPFEPAEEGLLPPTSGFERGRIYSGGCLDRFRQLANLDGDQVLYVGDHIYGDVLRAKKESTWRTMMVIQEMDHELRVHEELSPVLDRMDQLEAIRDLLHEEMRQRRGALKGLGSAQDWDKLGDSERTQSLREKNHHRRNIDQIRKRLLDLDTELEELETRVDRAFQPFWGSLLKAGPEVSLFGDQVEQYACLYTDRVSNLLHYNPLHYFRSPRDRMPHEVF